MKVFKAKRLNQTRTKKRKNLEPVPPVAGLKANSEWLAIDMGT